jgi:hypothetical protein
VVSEELLCRENHALRRPQGDVCRGCRRRCYVNSFDGGGDHCFEGCCLFSGRVEKNNVLAGWCLGFVLLLFFFFFLSNVLAF